MSPTSQDQTSYSSFATLREAHHELLKLRGQDANRDEFVSQIEAFVRRAQATGALISDESQRVGAQSILDYWSTVLTRAGRREPYLLDEFDPSLAPDLDEKSCPYVGLNAFREVNRSYFFGREEVVTEIVKKLESSRFLAVLGPSGSGKSSVVLAGLLPLLKESGKWYVYPPILPGSHPLENLALLAKPGQEGSSEWIARERDSFVANPARLVKLLGSADERRALIVIDQFEEVFTLSPDDSIERKAMVSGLLSLIQAPGAKDTIIVTMREDYEQQVPKLGDLRPYFEENQIRLKPLGADDLNEAIERPAKLVGLEFDRGIVPALVKEILGEPAALPLLQFTLLKLWQNREHNRVTWEAYNRLGGPKKALRSTADDFYNHLSTEDQRTTKNIFMHLVRPSVTLEVTSNRVKVESLVGLEDPMRVRRVLAKLVRANLLRETKGETSADDQVEVAHEALIRNWPTLLDWLDQERANLRQRSEQRTRLAVAAQLWRAHGRDSSGLLRGPLLTEAAGFTDLDEVEKEFVHASGKAAKRAELKRRGFIAALILVTLVAVALAGYAYRQKQKADASAEQSFSRELASNAVSNLATDPELSLLLGMEAVKTTYPKGQATYEAVNALHQGVENSRVRATLKGHNDSVISVAFNPSGDRLVTCGLDGTLKAWDRATGNELYSIPTGQQKCFNVAFSPRGDLLATAGADKTAKLWYADSGRLKGTLIGHRAAVYGVAFSHDGRRLATASADKTAKLWDISSTSELHTLAGHKEQVLRVAFSPDDRRLVTASFDNTAKVWNATSGKPVRTLSHTDVVTSVAFSPDGMRLVTGCGDKTARIWDATKFKEISVLSGHSAGVFDIAFSPDGNYVATASLDGTAKIWEFPYFAGRLPRELMSFSGHAGALFGLAFSPDGKWVATASKDSTLKIWDTGPNGELPSIKVPGHLSQWVVLTRDASEIAFASYSEPLTVVELMSGKVLFNFHGPAAFMFPEKLIISSNGKRAVLVSSARPSYASYREDTVQIWNLTSSNEKPITLPLLDSQVNGVGLDVEGKLVEVVSKPLAGSPETSVSIWDGDSGTRSGGWVLGKFQEREGEDSTLPVVGFSADGKRLAVAGMDGSISIHDAQTGVKLATTPRESSRDQAEENIRVTSYVRQLEFSPNDERLAVIRPNNTIDIFDARTGENKVTLAGHSTTVTALAFSPEGDTLASGGTDKTVKIWNLASGDQLLNLSASNRSVTALAFSPDRMRLIVAASDGTVLAYAIDVGDLLRVAKTRATRPLSAEECKRYLHTACVAKR